jgi:hypothetical protein
LIPLDPMLGASTGPGNRPPDLPKVSKKARLRSSAKWLTDSGLQHEDRGEPQGRRIDVIGAPLP